MENVESGKLYTLQQVADLTGVKLSNLRYWAKRGQIQAKKYGRQWMLSGEGVRYFIEHGTEQASGKE